MHWVKGCLNNVLRVFLFMIGHGTVCWTLIQFQWWLTLEGDFLRAWSIHRLRNVIDLTFWQNCVIENENVKMGRNTTVDKMLNLCPRWFHGLREGHLFWWVWMFPWFNELSKCLHGNIDSSVFPHWKNLVFRPRLSLIFVPENVVKITGMILVAALYHFVLITWNWCNNRYCNLH